VLAGKYPQLVPNLALVLQVAAMAEVQTLVYTGQGFWNSVAVVKVRRQHHSIVGHWGVVEKLDMHSVRKDGYDHVSPSNLIVVAPNSTAHNNSHQGFLGPRRAPAPTKDLVRLRHGPGQNLVGNSLL
jgi:hypothetical protein